MRKIFTIITTVLAACSEGADGDTTSRSGTLTVSLDGMVDVQGKILLATLTSTTIPSQPIAGLCVPITSSPFAMAEVMKPRKVGADNPCDLETFALVVDPGSYQLTLGVYTGGSRTPELCSNMEVVIDGDTKVVAPLPGGC